MRGISTAALLSTIVVCLVMINGGCKEGDRIVGGISPATAAFDEDPAPIDPTGGTVALRQGSVDGGRITIDVVVTEINEPVTGISLKLTYPSSFSKFTGCSDGEVFEPGTCHSSEPGPGSGEVLVGRSVEGLDQATDVPGSRVIVRLDFLVFGQGAGPIVIEGQNLGGADVSAIHDLAGEPVLVEWVSGRLSGT